MNRKIIFIGLGIILLGLVIGGWLLFFYTPKGTISENIRDILPFGEGGGNLSAPADNDIPEEIIPTEANQNLPSLFRLSEVPVGGAVGFLKNNSTFVRYVDRATGHIYDINPGTLEKTKITNTTQPKIYEAKFKKDGSGVIYRSLRNDSDEIITTSIELMPPKGTSTATLYQQLPTILRGGITSIDIGDNARLAYYLADSNTINTSAFNGSASQVAYESLFRDWNMDWAGGTITLVTKGSAYVPGNGYSLNPTSGLLKKLKGPLNGLGILRNPTETSMIYSYNDNGLTRTFFENIQSGENYEISSTFVDKCVWGVKNKSVIYCGVPQGGIENNEPDLWYQGRTHYSDDIVRFDLETSITETTISPKKDFNVDIDAINPILTPDEDYLIFMNKNDLSLWALKLVE